MENIVLVNIPDNLKTIRRTLNLSQTQVADQTGIVRSFYSDVENGKKTPSFDFLLKFALKYNVSLDFIFFNSGSMFREDNEFLSTIDSEWIELLKIMTGSGQDMEQKFIDIIKSAFKLSLQARSEKKD